MSVDSLLLTVYLAVAVIASLVVHEYAHAFVAVRLGDPVPKQAGRLTLNPVPHVDRFGTLVLPGILLLPVPFGQLFPIFAYAKPQPLNPWNLRNRNRDSVLIALAGPLANVALAFVFGALFRLSPTGQPRTFVAAALLTTVTMGILHIVPIPGLDGSRVVARFLPPRAEEVYTNLAQYLALWMLLIFFLLPNPIFGFVGAIGDGICRAVAGTTSCVGPLIQRF